MSNNLLKRILTSIILLFILFFCLLTSKFLWIYLLIIASIISFFEFNNLLKKIYKNKNNKIINFNLIFIIAICILSDTGGYFIGKSIGGKKLTKISPNKTISGSIGSFIFSLFPILIIEIFKINFISSYTNNNILTLVYLCLSLSLICQLGDLFISYFKRKAKVKDTGSLLPGHGGLLDRIDGFIFVLPTTYLLDRLFF